MRKLLFVLVAVATCSLMGETALAGPEAYWVDEDRVGPSASVVEVDENGVATVAWEALGPGGSLAVRIARVTRDGGVGKIRSVANRGYENWGFDFDLSLDRRGRGFVTWAGENNEVFAAPISANGHVGPAAFVTKGFVPDVETDRRGAGTIFIARRGRLLAARLRRSGEPSELVTITPGYLEEFDVAVDPGGDATVVTVSPGRSWLHEEVRVIRVPAGREIRPKQVLSRPAEHQLDGGAPAVATAPNGRAVVAWVGGHRRRTTILSATISARGRAGGVQTLDNGVPRDASFPAVNSLGSGWIVSWSRRSNRHFGNQIVFKRLTRRGRPGWATPLSGKEGARGGATLAGARDATVIWRTAGRGTDGELSCISSRRITPDGRPLRTLRIPDTCTASRGPDAEFDSGANVLATSWTGLRAGVAFLGGG
jgi:hypothetical protein